MIAVRRFTIKYGRDGEKHRYTHSRDIDLDRAKRNADGWRRGMADLDPDKGPVRVWIEDDTGKVVYGREATRP